ncbi:MAG TPA: hypothetical protein VFR91_05145 [Dyella sp.]|nr:hypothetical protein [Dyella sp.]
MKSTRPFCLAGCLLLALGMAAAHAAAPLQVTYPRPESRRDGRAGYPLELLRLALDHSGVAYDLRASPVPMQQARVLRQLARGEGLDIAWSVTTRERERDLLPIRIPIDRGLIGWRVLLIRKDEQDRMHPVHTLSGLAALWGGQGHDWPDLDVLRANGLKVLPSPTYEGLFAMLQKGRIDYFPRAVAEVGPEMATHAYMGLTIEDHLLLHYPSALYFFVNPANHRLADAVRLGLERAIADGSMDALFRRTYGSLPADLDLRHRDVIELANPDFPQDAPTDRPELWFQPGSAP